MLSKLEKYLFYIFLFSIPFQIRKILWFEGWRFNEWQSISVYVTDIFLVILLIFWLFNFNLKLKKSDYFLILFWAISGISIFNSSSYLVSIFQWIKLTEFIIFYWYLSQYAFRKFGLYNSFLTIFISGLFQAIIAIIQFLKQGSLGLKYLGESVFNKDLTGVASFYLPSGEKILRVYGTTPHPNVLAAYLFLALFAFYFVWFYKKSKHEKWFIGAYLLTLVGFLFTFSRVSFFLVGVSYLIVGFIIFLKYKKFERKRLWQIIIYTGIALFIFGIIYWPEVMARIKISGEEDAVQLRNFYNKESLHWLSLTGVGIGTFVHELAIKMPFLENYLYQPVHNIYLLIYSETGVFGISAFILFLSFLVKDFIIKTKMTKFYQYYFLLLFSSFLFMGLFDHFLWTLQQGRFIFWFTLSLLTIDKYDDIISPSTKYN